MVKLNPFIDYKAAEMVSKDANGSERYANKALIRAKALASEHKDTGDYMRSLKVTMDTYKSRGGYTIHNYYVTANDSQARRIEYGHLSKSGKWVEGQYILERAKIV